MKEEYLKEAIKIITDPNILVNVVSRRVRQLQQDGQKPAIENYEAKDPEDIALREIIEGKLTYELAEDIPEE